MPNPRNMEASVYITSTLHESQIWAIGKQFVGDPQTKPIYGRGDLLASIVFEQKLDVVFDPKPHELHANIRRWPTTKDKQQMIAVELANAAKLALP